MNEKEIIVKIDINDFPDKWVLTSTMFECWVIPQLKEAGIPINGMIMFNGVKRGTLEASKSFDNDVITYRWRP